MEIDILFFIYEFYNFIILCYREGIKRKYLNVKYS